MPGVHRGTGFDLQGSPDEGVTVRGPVVLDGWHRTAVRGARLPKTISSQRLARARR